MNKQQVDLVFFDAPCKHCTMLLPEHIETGKCLFSNTQYATATEPGSVARAYFTQRARFVFPRVRRVGVYFEPEDAMHWWIVFRKMRQDGRPRPESPVSRRSFPIREWAHVLAGRALSPW